MLACEGSAKSVTSPVRDANHTLIFVTARGPDEYVEMKHDVQVGADGGTSAVALGRFTA
jgi:hypothetical protein